MGQYSTRHWRSTVVCKRRKTHQPFGERASSRTVARWVLHPWKILRHRRHKRDNTDTSLGSRLPGSLLSSGHSLDHSLLRLHSTPKLPLFHHGWHRCDFQLLGYTRCQAHTCRVTFLPRIPLKIGWLFLFAVLMAAGLLFTMVFFVCAALGFHRVHLTVMPNADVLFHTPL